MKKRNSIVVKLSLITIGSFIVLFSIFNIITNIILYNQSRDSSEELVTLATNKTASEISERFSRTIASLQNDEEIFQTLKQKNQLTSQMIIDFKTKSLQNNPDTIGTSVIIKADELQEIAPEHEQYIDAKGYFAPYIVQSNNEITIEQLDDATGGIWYTETEQTKKLSITEPYEFTIDGQATAMMTITLPLLRNDKLIGVTVVDFPLNFVEGIIANNIPATSIQRVASVEGIIFLDSGSADNVNESLEKFVPDWQATLQKIQAGENTSFYADSVTFGEEAYAVFAPITINGYDRHLMVETFIPKSTIFAVFYKTLRISFIAAAIISIILAAAIYFFIHRSLKPLNLVRHSLSKAANGELTAQVTQDNFKNDEIGAVATAYNQMRTQVSKAILFVSDEAGNITNSSQATSRSIEEISQSSQDMSTAIQEIAAGAQFQANEIESANFELTKLGTKMNQLSDVADHMLTNIAQSNEQAKKGKLEMHKLHDQSEQSSEDNGELVMQMGLLANQISQINAVMATIQGITDQTNLLALNASIEAARAGEYGKGFAVVAEEVRKLAEQSKNETTNVQTIVGNILRESEQTRQLAERNSANFSKQLQSVTNAELAFNEQLIHAEQLQTKIAELLAELDEMMKEKEIVMNSMQSVAAISEQSAAGAEEISASAEEQYNEILKIVQLTNDLHDVSIKLKDHTSFFKV